MWGHIPHAPCQMGSPLWTSSIQYEKGASVLPPALRQISMCGHILHAACQRGSPVWTSTIQYEDGAFARPSTLGCFSCRGTSLTPPIRWESLSGLRRRIGNGIFNLCSSLWGLR